MLQVALRDIGQLTDFGARARSDLYPHFGGLYLSFETGTRPERLGDAFPAPTLERLSALKRHYDPDNVFRDNFNIAPWPAPPAR